MFNSFDEWKVNLSNSFETELLDININIVNIYKLKYLLTEKNINQLFNLLIINNPNQLFIILSTFINHYDITTSNINFDDYNSSTDTNLLQRQITKQEKTKLNKTKWNKT